MWPTVDGIRVLAGDEAELIRRGTQAVIDRLREQVVDGPAATYGIDWFDQWDLPQQLWLLDRVNQALLTDQPPPPPAAMWEATIDVIFLEVIEQIQAECEVGWIQWRQLVVSALGRPTEPTELRIDDAGHWRQRVTQVADQILGVPSYQKAEAFRDRDPGELRRFLMQRGLPEDYLERIPPVI